MMSYEEAWTWLEGCGGGVYASRRDFGEFWTCSVGGVRGMPEVRCSGYGYRHDEALRNAVQELRDLHDLLTHPTPLGDDRAWYEGGF